MVTHIEIVTNVAYRSVNCVTFNIVIQLQVATRYAVGCRCAMTLQTLVITWSACPALLVSVKVTGARLDTVVYFLIASALYAVPRRRSVAFITHQMTWQAFLYST